jgi:AcrR family transcriptional regulator
MTRRPRNPAKSTRDRLLDTAERLFAVKGIRATTLREITDAARINNAAVNYHFRSKDDLIRSVFERCFRPVNDDRLRCLTAAEEAAGNGPLTVEAILRALFEPSIRAWKANRNFILLAGRLLNEPDPELHAFSLELYEELIQRFLVASRRALPGVPDADLFFWLHFLFGGVVHTLLSSDDIERLSGGLRVLHDPEHFTDRLVAFGAAALHARVALAKPDPTTGAKSVTNGRSSRGQRAMKAVHA